MQTTLERHRSKLAEEALLRAQGNTSIANYAAIYKGFEEKGIAEEDITPRVNVLTFEAWRAKGRTVKKGEHGIKIFTRVNGVKRQEDGSDKAYTYPKMTTVFHISQTADSKTAAEIRAESVEEKNFLETKVEEIQEVIELEPVLDDFQFSFEPEAAPAAKEEVKPGKRDIFAIMNKGKQDELKF